MLTLTKIIKFVMSSAPEAELGAMFVTEQEIVAMRQTVQEMKWPHPKSPLQTENSAAAGVVNNTIVPGKIKTMDRRLHLPSSIKIGLGILCIGTSGGVGPLSSAFLGRWFY